MEASIYEQRHGQSAHGMVKTFSDVQRYREIIAKVKPCLIVECGTFSAKSALWFALEASCKVVTIDVNPHIPDEATKEAAKAAGVVMFAGSSTDPEIIDAVKAMAGLLAPSEPIMVILDSDHSAAHVAAEIAAYAPLVTVGSYLVVEDGIVRWLPGEQKPLGPYTGSPLDAAEQWIADHPNQWVNDAKLEDMFETTQHPGGWLKRINR